jgi:hypothetical protein
MTIETHPDAEHSLLSASGSPGWIACYAYLAQRATVPETGSPAARKGTAGHTVTAQVLENMLGRETGSYTGNVLTCDAFIGNVIDVEGEEIEITDDFAAQLQRYVDKVWSIYKSEPSATLLVETKVNYAAYLGVATHLAWGTSDAIIYLPLSRRIVVVDLKTGYGWVSAVNNSQERLYGLGAFDELALAYEIDEVTTAICMTQFMDDDDPDKGYTEETLSVADLKMWARTEAAMAAQHGVRNYELAQAQGIGAIPLDEFKPGDKQCQWCASGTCPKTTSMVLEVVANEFVDLDTPEMGTVAKTLTAKGDVGKLSNVELGDKMRWIKFIENWITSVRSAAEIKLLAGETVPGYKIVAGKKGSRAWADEEKATKTLKRVLGTKEAMTEPKPISPTQAEKYVKTGKLTARQWTALQELITQKEGGRHVAPEDDPRPAIPMTPTAEAFENLEGDGDDLSHLA